MQESLVLLSIWRWKQARIPGQALIESEWLQLAGSGRGERAQPL